MAIIVGLEGVLCRHEWRHELIDSEGWPEYYKAAERDAPNRTGIEIVNAMQRRGHHVYCISVRPDQWRMLTVSWLVRHGVMVDTVMLRPDGDWQNDDKVRADWLAIVRESASEIFCAIDENEKACNFWRAAGLPTLQLTNPNNGDA